MFPVSKPIFQLPATNFQTVSAGKKQRLFWCSVVLIGLFDSCSNSSAEKYATIASDSLFIAHLFNFVFVETDVDWISIFTFKEQMY